MFRLTASTWPRRLTGAVVILLVAGAVLVWGRSRAAASHAAIEESISSLCQAVARDEPIDDRLLPADPSLRDPLRATLRRLLDRVPQDQVSLVIAPGDHPTFGDGSASHTVTILVRGDAALGLRLRASGRPPEPLIIGYWLPQPPPAP